MAFKLRRQALITATSVLLGNAAVDHTGMHCALKLHGVCHQKALHGTDASRCCKQWETRCRSWRSNMQV